VRVAIHLHMAVEEERPYDVVMVACVDGETACRGYAALVLGLRLDPEPHGPWTPDTFPSVE
jgi:hypothetical protein